MSNTLAIATATAVLEARVRALLADAGLAGFAVVADMPKGDEPDEGVYLKPYRIVPNPTLRGLDLPTRRADGSVIRRPRMAIDVDYALCFVGDPGDYGAERLAGLVLTDLHARPGLSQQEIGDYLAGLPSDHVLSGADLGDQLERVKLTPLPLSLEDLTRVWGLTNQAYYVLTVAYQASVIVLDAEVEPVAARPVVERGIHVAATLGPAIHEVVSSVLDQPVVAIDLGTPQALVVRGTGLASVSTWLRIGTMLFEIPAADILPGEIRLSVTPALGLRSGVTSVQVVHRVELGPASDPDPYRTAAESNTLPFALLPAFEAASPNATPIAGGLQIRVDVTPIPATDQDVTLMLDRIGGTTHVSSTTWSLDGSTMVFTVDTVPAGDYLLRLRVDGATTIPRRDGSGALGDPHVTVP